MRNHYSAALACVKASKYKRALTLFGKALKNSGTPEDKAECHRAIGDTARMTGDFTLAEKHYAAAMKASLKAKDVASATDASVGLALALRALGKWADALEIISDAEAYYKAQRDDEGMAFVTWAKAGALRIKGDIPRAVKAFGDAKARYEKLGDARGVGYSLCGMGGTSRVLGDFKGSLEYYQAANKSFRKQKDSFGTAYSHCGIGNALRMRGKLNEAREQFVRAAQIYRRIGDIVSYSYTLWSLGKTHAMAGNVGMADKFYKDARANFRKTGDPRGVIYCKLGQLENKAMSTALPSRLKALAVSARHALAEAEKYGFAVERAHAEVLLACLEGSPTAAPYRKIGLTLTCKGLPMNIP